MRDHCDALHSFVLGCTYHSGTRMVSRVTAVLKTYRGTGTPFRFSSLPDDHTCLRQDRFQSDFDCVSELNLEGDSCSFRWRDPEILASKV